MKISVEIRATAIDTLIIIAPIIIVGVLIGLWFRQTGSEESAAPFVIGTILTLTLAFFVVGMRTTNNYWSHLMSVALCSWGVSFSSIFLGASIVQWFFNGTGFLLFMGVGGGIALLVRKFSKEAN